MSAIENSEIMTDMSLKLAEDAVPDEVDLAPIMVQAFVEGGKEREELFKQEQGSVVGGFSPGGLIALFPWILRALAQHGPSIYKLLTTDVSDLISLLDSILDLGDRIRASQKIKSLPDNPYQPLKIVMQTISSELQVSGLPEDQCDLITYRVIRALLESPEDSTVFIKTLERSK